MRRTSRTVRPNPVDGTPVRIQRGTRPPCIICACPLLHQVKPATHLSNSLSISRSQARGKGPPRKGHFGVVPGRSERIPGRSELIPGLSASSSTMSHRYFIESPSHVLGFHHGMS